MREIATARAGDYDYETLRNNALVICPFARLVITTQSIPAIISSLLMATRKCVIKSIVYPEIITSGGFLRELLYVSDHRLVRNSINRVYVYLSVFVSIHIAGLFKR